MPANSLVRLHVPAVAYTAETVNATVAQHVRAGDATSRATVYDAAATMCVGLGATSATVGNTTAALLRFFVASPASVQSAVLRLQLSSVSAGLSAHMPMVLYVTTDSSWTAGTATWDSLSATATSPLKLHPPAGAPTGWAYDALAKTFVNYAHTGLEVAGHVTLAAGTAAGAQSGVKMVDVTSAVRAVAATGGIVNLLLVRTMRNNAETSTGTTPCRWTASTPAPWPASTLPRRAPRPHAPAAARVSARARAPPICCCCCCTSSKQHPV